ncbi:hypothetical protein CIHG_04972 [Coccidioides immitis H538.4]|uniref:Uncharacterized protein n=1 Tax=Coccidioides immitis H538.4 TaxID=396776 RepID=A0A0J8RQB6_COCIT|nr:hypothetical protein CIHG_04972 [Coccidioides immitis H538.4]
MASATRYEDGRESDGVPVTVAAAEWKDRASPGTSETRSWLSRSRPGVLYVEGEHPQRMQDNAQTMHVELGRPQVSRTPGRFRAPAIDILEPGEAGALFSERPATI